MQVHEGMDVRVDGKSVRPLAEKTYIKLYKPVGIVCTADTREKNNVIDFVGCPIRVTYAGRLDRNSEGLLLLTNDGDLSEALMRSRNAHEKEYEVTVSRPFTDSELQLMREGIYLKEIDQTTRPCRIDWIGENRYCFILTQGLNRQIRRMCACMGVRVRKLKRVRIATLQLGDLQLGEWRYLTREETEKLRETIYAD